jgi:hypothetical protein
MTAEGECRCPSRVGIHFIGQYRPSFDGAGRVATRQDDAGQCARARDEDESQHGLEACKLPGISADLEHRDDDVPGDQGAHRHRNAQYHCAGKAALNGQAGASEPSGEAPQGQRIGDRDCDPKSVELVYHDGDLLFLGRRTVPEFALRVKVAARNEDAFRKQTSDIEVVFWAFIRGAMTVDRTRAFGEIGFFAN